MSDTNPSLPVLFISHGAPSLILENSPSKKFVESLCQTLPKPRAILCISAHWMTPDLRITGATHPETIHDFSGFPDELYALRYPAPGEPALAQRIASLLTGAGHDCEVDMQRGFDHGVWSPLFLAYPKADIPVIALSLPNNSTAQSLYRIGGVLKDLTSEGILILGSGGATHNLDALKQDASINLPLVNGFQNWLDAALNAGDIASLLNWEHSAPQGLTNHPTPEHFWPLFICLGAGGFPDKPATALFQGLFMSRLSLASYRIG